MIDIWGWVNNGEFGISVWHDCDKFICSVLRIFFVLLISIVKQRRRGVDLLKEKKKVTSVIIQCTSCEHTNKEINALLKPLCW